MGTLTRAAVGHFLEAAPGVAIATLSRDRGSAVAIGDGSGDLLPASGAAPGDLVGDAHRHGIETQPTRDGRPVARLAWLSDTEGSAAECDKIPARSADDPGMTLIGPERESDQRRAGDLPHIAGV